MKLRSSKAACCLGATLVVMMMPVLPKVTDAKPTYEQHESTITDTEVRVASYAANVEEVILTGYEEQQGQMQNKALAITEPYLDVYSADDENSSVNGRLYKNTVVDVLEVNGSMTKIRSGNCEGYTKTAALLFNQEAEVIAQTLDDEDILTGYTIEEAEAKEAEEEAARIAEEEKAREDAKKAAQAAEERMKAKEKAKEGKNAEITDKSTSSESTASQQATVSSSGSGLGQSVANYAVQFVGNPYVYGGTSLTNGADCSGFVMSVYKNFGVSLPHSSTSDRYVGYNVGSLANAQPGDLVCYSGHVAIYIGGGQIVHASTEATGIKISNASYRTPVAIRRIF